MSLLEEFEDLCKYIREVTGSDLVCGLCEYDAGTVGEEPMECPGFDSNECFKLKESFKQRFPGYNGHEVIRCKECKYYKRVKWDQYDDVRQPKKKYCHVLKGEPIVVDTEPDDFCSYGERKKE